MRTHSVKAVLGGAILVALLAGCATLSLVRPQIQGVHPRITGIDFLGLNMAFDLDVYNPNPIALRQPHLRYALNVEGNRFFQSETTSLNDVPARGVGTVTFPVRLSYLDLLQAYHVLAGKPEADYRLEGAMIFPVRGRNLELPFSHSGAFPILRPPTFSDVRVRLGDVSPTNTRIDIDAAVKNPNVFPLGLNDLGYVLDLGGIRLGDLSTQNGGAVGAGQTQRLHLSGETSLVSAIVQLMKGGNLGEARLLPYGSVQTPYGAASLPR
jgi:LEA14-like dessication related protein